MNPSMADKKRNLEEEKKSIFISSPTSTMGKAERRETQDFEIGQNATKSHISELPCDLTMKILSLVPTRNLFYCSRVCKAWQSLLLNPHFTKLHIARSPPTYVLFGFHKDRDPPNTPSRYFEFLDIENESSCDYNLVCVSTTKTEPYSNARLLGSCNGLLCFLDWHSILELYVLNPAGRDYLVQQLPKLCVLNPITRECVNLPSVKPLSDFYHLLCGFGFVARTNQYKVLAMSDREGPNPKSGRWNARVYTLGTGTWRSLGVAPHDFCEHEIPGVHLDGNLHWLAYFDASLESFCISSFDLEGELFQSLVLPEITRTDPTLFLCILRGCLCVVSFSDEAYSQVVEIWVMRNYGVEESWYKGFFMKLDPSLRSLRPVNVVENEEIVLQCSGCYLASYNCEKGIFKEVTVRGSVLLGDVVVHVPSFISPKDIEGDHACG